MTGATESEGSPNIGFPQGNSKDGAEVDIERPYPRPPGRKEMKQRAKGKAKATNIEVNREILNSCSSFNESFERSCQADRVRDEKTQEGLNRSLQLKERSLELNERSILAMERKDMREQILLDQQIMSTDTSNMNSSQKEYHEYLVANILNKARGQYGQSNFPNYPPHGGHSGF